MRPVAEITDKRVASKMLEHVGMPSDAPELWPARGPPESHGAAPWLEVESRAPDHDTPPPNVE